MCTHLLVNMKIIFMGRKGIILLTNDLDLLIGEGILMLFQGQLLFRNLKSE